MARPNEARMCMYRFGKGTDIGFTGHCSADFPLQAGGLRLRGSLNGKVGGAFTSTATQHAGRK